MFSEPGSVTTSSGRALPLPLMLTSSAVECLRIDFDCHGVLRPVSVTTSFPTSLQRHNIRVARRSVPQAADIVQTDHFEIAVSATALTPSPIAAPFIFRVPRNSRRLSAVFTFEGEERMDNTTLLIVVIVLILLLGGGGWYGRGRWF